VTYVTNTLEQIPSKGANIYLDSKNKKQKNKKQKTKKTKKDLPVWELPQTETRKLTCFRLTHFTPLHCTSFLNIIEFVFISEEIYFSDVFKI
jgi:hypothetical protein